MRGSQTGGYILRGLESLCNVCIVLRALMPRSACDEPPQQECDSGILVRWPVSISMPARLGVVFSRMR